MAVRGALSVTLEVPDVQAGLRFYEDAGLVAATTGADAALRCEQQGRPAIRLLGGAPRKRLHHLSLLADDLDALALAAQRAGGAVVEAPPGHGQEGLWIADPHGMLIHLLDLPPEPAPPAGKLFEINAPGRLVRNRAGAVPPGSACDPVRPLKLGHILVFSPDVPKSVAFVTEALGMGLADHAEDVIAFCCARKDSDHHVLAFAKSAAVGFHHASFLVNDPDEVGRGGRTLVEKAKRGDWGFGRHTIGSNFFHYIQDPWGSWFEYYSDMDHIDDYAQWSPTNYALEDSLANWGPAVPPDFVHNYEADDRQFPLTGGTLR